MSAHRCYGEHIAHRAGDVPSEHCCDDRSVGEALHAETCPLADHDDCDFATCAMEWPGVCDCPCDRCVSAKADALAEARADDDYEAQGDAPEREDYE